MIASPGDVLEERNVARDVIHEWNYVSSSASNVVLMPVGWETHSSPELSGRPQELINDRVLKNCDLLIGIFWTRLGTPTGTAASGTAEEIERHIEAGKPAMVYFSTAPVAPQSLDQFQFNALTEFRAWCQKRGLVETFENLLDFRQKFARQLQITLNNNPYLTELRKSAGPATGVVIPSTAPDQREASRKPSLSEEAIQLLLEATLDKSGVILKLAFIGGRSIQTNGKTFGDSGDRRSVARWEYALGQLVTEGLVVARGQKDQMFEVTQPGYQLADAMRSQKR
jgi:hypothetical protein